MVRAGSGLPGTQAPRCVASGRLLPRRASAFSSVKRGYSDRMGLSGTTKLGLAQVELGSETGIEDGQPSLATDGPGDVPAGRWGWRTRGSRARIWEAPSSTGGQLASRMAAAQRPSCQWEQRSSLAETSKPEEDMTQAGSEAHQGVRPEAVTQA